jgi:hypothetical protein
MREDNFKMDLRIYGVRMWTEFSCLKERIKLWNIVKEEMRKWVPKPLRVS